MSQNNTISLKNKSILIIDDQKSFQKLLKGMLLQLGANNIVYYDSGEAALSKFDKESVDIVFIDYNLGQGRNGKQFLEELKYLNKLSRHCISILVTGESTRSVVLSVLEIEPDDYLIKPFSIGMLKSRLSKLSTKKHIFSEANQAIEEQDYEHAINCYQNIATQQPRLTQLCHKQLCQLYISLEHYTDAHTLLSQILVSARPTWALTYMAQVRYLTASYDQAIRICDELLGQNRFNIDALDIKALCLNELNQAQESLFLIEQSCNISPLSYARQQKYATIAQNNGVLSAVAKAHSNLLVMAEGTAFASINHHLNYIRTLLSQLDSHQAKAKVSALISEIKSALRHATKDTCVIEQQALFNDFENFCNARLNCFADEYLAAKKLLAPYLAEQSLNATLLPDSIMALFAIGEFDDAATQLEKYKTLAECNQHVLAQLEQQNSTLSQRKSEFEQHNKQGIALYKKGQYRDAISQFEAALSYAPMNTGSALNLLQALLQLLPQAPSSAEMILAKCQSNFVLVEGMALPLQHAKRLADLKHEYNKLAKMF